MSLDLAAFQTWLTGQLTSTPVQANRMQQTPDKVVAFSATGTLAPILDGAFQPYRLEVRSRDVDDVAAKVVADAVHAVFLANQGSLKINGVQSLLKVQSAPVYSGRDAENRAIYRGLYQITVPA